ncbi:MAG TPA: hypothetical protein VM010_03525 [Chitinophagaceae bacterium]|nr:hypothetical protein [Chitinophagaceae bacterium]
MKHFILMATTALFFTACNDASKTGTASAAPKNTDLIQQHLQGKVERLTETTYMTDSAGNMGKMDSVIVVTDFDEKGYITKYQEQDSTGKVRMEQTITHNAKGNFLEVKSMKDGRQTFRLVTELDSSGNYTGGKTYDSTGNQDSYYKDLKTNEYGIVYAGKRYGLNDKIKETFDMNYDKTNFLGGKTTDSTGKTAYEGTIKVNDKGYAIEETSTTRQKDSTKTEKMTYQYNSTDEKGNWTQRTTYNEKGKPTKITKRTFVYYKD